MQVPEIPANEAQRLQALRDSALLDTASEERFDRITRLAREIFGTKIALISLVDANRQWFKSRQGLTVDETSRDISFCGHAILNDEIFEVAEADRDPRFSDNPLVTGPPHIRFYAGAPLQTPDGSNIGTLCIIDDRRRRLSESERAILRSLGDCIQAEINRLEERQLRVRLEQEHKLLEIIAHVQAGFIDNCGQRQALDRLLTEILDLTQSAYGLIGGVRRMAEGRHCLRIKAVKEIGQDREPRSRDDDIYAEDPQCHDLDGLIGAAVASERPVIAGNLSRDPRPTGLPCGHPPITDLLAIPIRHGAELVAVLSLANRPNGYDETLIAFLEPLLMTLGQLIHAARIQAWRDESESRLAAVIEGTHAATWEWNLQTGEVQCNARWAAILGYTPEELAPINIRSWLSSARPEDRLESEQLLQRHLSGELPYYAIEPRIRHRDGRWIWVHDQGSVISWTNDGKPLLMSGIRTDITEHKIAELALQQSESRLRGLFELSPIGNALNDCETGAFLEVNNALVQSTGYSREELLSLDYMALTPKEYEVHEARQLQDLETTGRYGPFEKEYIRKDGSRYPVLLNGMLVLDPSGKRLIWSMIEDISERKRLERMKNEFVSTISHELRTPLTSIRGSLGLVGGGAVGEIPPKARHLLDIALNNTDRLVRLINDILDIEKIDSGKMQFEMTPQLLKPVVERAIESSRGLENQYGVQILLMPDAADALVRIDADRITQVLLNLISNAAKFSPRHERIRLSIDRTEAGVRISVADSGPGIPDTFRGRIFERFAQADASDTRGKGGSGLGLSICRAIIREHRGSIGFDSEPGQGCVFHVELPAVVDITESFEPARAPDPKRSGARILVCEDDPDVAALIRIMLEQGDYQVDIAPDAAWANRMIATTSYDAVTMDLSLPGEDGLSFIRTLHRGHATRDLPIVVLSANAEEGRAQLAGAAVGVVDWLSKPIDRGRLLAAIQRATRSGAPKILCVEDDHDLALVIKNIIGNQGQVYHAESLKRAEEWLDREQFDLVMLDLSLPDGQGLSLLPMINGTDDPPPVLVFSADELSPDLMREVGAALVKSRTDHFKLVETVNALINSRGREPTQ